MTESLPHWFFQMYEQLRRPSSPTVVECSNQNTAIAERPCARQRVSAEHRRRYGYRRVTAELRRRGMLVNHKRVARVMREDDLLAVQPKRFVTTTDSNHRLEVYLNLARRMMLTGTDQLWVADMCMITLLFWTTC